ncbi:dTDP-4-dehydrorhamnose reductase [Roseivivax sp. CAU 1753]
MTVLVFGRSGQVATELARAGGVTCLGRTDCDIADADAIRAAIAAHAPRAVINAAAYTAVDRAEEDEATAFALNARGPGAMAGACAARGIPLVHISTDYVFAGTGTAPHRPDDPVAPINAYGRSKLAGEEAVRAAGSGAGGVHAILRTSWVVSAHGTNFVKTMLRLGADRDSLGIVADQVGGPTPARAIAAACLSIADQLIADPARTGTWHFAGAPPVSWADFARAIFDAADITCAVTDIPTADYPTPAARPLNSRLDCSATETVFGLKAPDWRAGLHDILKELSP